MDRRILIMGGTGVFGKRLARHLATFGGIELFISSRTAAKAQTFVQSLKTKTPDLKAQGVAIDHRKNLDAQLVAIKPFAVIDCSGPFQTANYDAAQTILKAGAHLIDLADARDYLANFTQQLDALARESNVAALTGASTTPTLSSCVVEHVTRNWQRIDTIDICITPGGKSEVGRSVIEAILSYAGKRIPIWVDGHLTQTTGWTGAKIVNIPKLGRRRVAPVETYDAEYLGPRHNVQSRVAFSAGLESAIEQRGIEIIATLRKYKLFPSPLTLIPLLLKARLITRIPTSDQGGMLVEISGLDASGQFTQTKWSLLAKNDHGPFIPVLPAATALQKLLENEVPSGAFLANQHMALPDILTQMTPYEIVSQTEVSHANQSAIEAYLGVEQFGRLPQALKEFHGQDSPPIWSGQATVQRGSNGFAKALAWAFGFPEAGVSVPLTVRVDRTLSHTGNPVERWTRIFASKSLSSVLQRQADGSFSEQFSPFTFTLGLNVDEQLIRMPVTKWTIGKVPLPMSLSPQSDTKEFQDAHGRFNFDVRLTVPFIGLLAHYRGWLIPTSA
ncbi:DUF4166 domain-containing protein [Roseovarius sp. Pro17]|uniref:DUF4166 domain-containing protein n=1 Tax=Roseovarius sp. Pro17 TaxID=3108175 RepID=UPI002D797A10|nr:DUF4166 domain-containing protein [Roseovarius sp. Pro17]